jgi:molybdopterin molybdotransferase
MISTQAALDTVLEHAGMPETVDMALARAAGHVLAADVVSDIDMPPFDRSAMDGFAVAGQGKMHALREEITAGDARAVSLEPGVAAPIMTGAPVPPGADRVVMVEHARVEENRLHVETTVPQGANICRRAEDIQKGQTVLFTGRLLAPQHLGIADMAGRGVLRVYRKPTVGVVTTGTEVIASTWIPKPGQIRNANLDLMRAQLEQAGFAVHIQLHAADDPASLRATFAQLLACCDVVLIAGGVSMGTRDYVPAALETSGVKLLFRTVAQKPGKPLTFGIGPGNKPVFGLPGNPVSVMVCGEEYVLPLLRKKAGFSRIRKRTFRGTLKERYRKKKGRLHFLRVRATDTESGLQLQRPDSSGSGDLMSTAAVNALALVESDVVALEAGSVVDFHFLCAEAGELSFTESLKYEKTGGEENGEG